MTNPACVDKWLLASCLQKAVRRGRPEHACNVYRMLHALDPSYARYRTAIVAVEDVGLANTDVVLNTLQAIQEKQSDTSIVDYVGNLASGAKDRTPCILGSLACWPSQAPMQWETLNSQDASRIVFDALYPLPIRSAAAFRAVGTDVFPHPLLTTLKGDIDAFKTMATSLGASEKSIAILDSAKNLHKEWHSLFIPMLDVELQTTLATMHDDPYALDNLPLIDGLPSEGFDSHTRVGKEACRMLWNHHPDLRSAWSSLREGSMPEQEALDSVESMLFLLEGQLVHPVMRYPMALIVQDLQKKRWSTRFKMDGLRAATILWAYRCRIHELREYVYQKLR